jgi:hypothetical protein
MVARRAQIFGLGADDWLILLAGVSVALLIAAVSSEFI